MVKLNELFCKGCSFCVKFCPKGILELGTERNRKGHFFPHVTDPSKCISCGICATMCPEAALEIHKEDGEGTK